MEKPFDTNYIVHSNGHIYSVRSKKFLKPQRTNWGYCIVKLYGKFISVHTIVAKTFIPNPNNLPQVNHKNLDKTDNRVENLEWITCRNNINHFHNSKFPGVWYDKNRKKYFSKIRHNSKQIYLGRYKTQEEAHQAYINYRVIHNI
tara:strand:- start:32 stop:466 length:435 start_codon:yes stop_codon:yes gene_type:complete